MHRPILRNHNLHFNFKTLLSVQIAKGKIKFSEYKIRGIQKSGER
uniref:Uncharacterized protein n=1 Tax=Manihot esculenta TaxID=3983 RepID=A0A2C9WII5_MANES